MTTGRTSSLAMASLICGVASWVVAPLVGSLVAVICGHMARRQIRTSYEDGDAMALIGLVLGYLNLIASCAGMMITALALLGVVSCAAVGAAAG